MPRIAPFNEQEVSAEVLAARDAHARQGHRITNMKRALLHSLPAFRALMEWYPLHDEVARFLGARATLLFAHAISAENDCLICSTYFRRILIDRGEDPDRLSLDQRESAVVAYGRQLAQDPHGVSDDLYGRMAGFLRPPEIVALTAFGALMIATNVVNDALRVELDEYLYQYRASPGVAPEGDRPWES